MNEEIIKVVNRKISKQELENNIAKTNIDRRKGGTFILDPETGLCKCTRKPTEMKKRKETGGEK